MTIPNPIGPSPSDPNPRDIAEVAGDGDGIVLRLQVQPGATRARVVGRHGDALKVAVHAAPERGKANDAVLALVAALLGVRPAQVSLLAGATSRRKRVLVRGVTLDELGRALEGNAPPSR